jgi:hypothetical protein
MILQETSKDKQYLSTSEKDLINLNLKTKI